MFFPPRALVALVLFTGSTPSLHAQQPFAAGRAAGHGLAAVVEARGGVAGAWNPALGMLAEANGAWTLLGVDAAGSPGARSLFTEGRDVLGSERLRAWSGENAVEALPVVASAHAARGDAGVLWFGAQRGALTASLASYAWMDAYLPTTLGDGPDTTAARPSRHALVSELSLARAVGLGTLPALGRIWAGAGVRLRHAHSVASGTWSEAEAGVDFDWTDYPDSLPADQRSDASVLRYRETRLTGRQVAGLDLGVLLQPTPSLLLGLVALDAATLERGGEVVTLDRLFVDTDAGAVMLGRDRELGREAAGEADTLAAELQRRMRPSPRLRAAASLDTRLGRLFAGAELGSAGDLQERDPARYSVGWAGPSLPLSPCLSWSETAAGAQAIRAAVGVGEGRLRLDVGVRHVRSPDALRMVGLSLQGSYTP